MSYEVAAFLTDFKDYQAQGGRLVDQVPVFQLNNVGELRTKGVEVDLAYQATAGLQLNASLPIRMQQSNLLKMPIVMMARLRRKGV